jgi:membrane protease YdiL (CAAX protease family)
MNKNTSLISSLWRYIKKPDYNLPPIEKSFKKKLGDILKYWSLGIVFAFFSTILSAVFLSNIGIDDSQNVLQDIFVSNSAIVIVLIIFFVGPITEELTFRLGLRYSPYRFGFALVFISFLLFELLLANNSWLEHALDMFVGSLGLFLFLSLVLILIISFGFLFGYILHRLKISKKINNFYQNNFALIFYSLTLIFGAVHFFNFSNFKDLWLVLPFLVAPQLFLGFILAYVRMRYSLAWAMFYHFFHNTMASLPILLFTQIDKKSFDIIMNGAEGDIFNIPFSDRLFLVAGIGVSLLIFLLFVIFFFFLIRNHIQYLKVKNKNISK